MKNDPAVSASPKEKLDYAVDLYGQARYEEGLETGLNVAEVIRAYITALPESKRRTEVLQWADTSIERARKLKTRP